MIRIEQLQIGDFRNFVYLLASEGEAFVIDPQSELEPWEDILTSKGLKLKGILLTHTHWDHIAGIPAILKKYGSVPIYVNEIDARRLLTSGAPERLGESLRYINDGDNLTLGDSKIKVWLTPGHSAGECSYLINDQNPPALFTGDTVFIGDVGRTDLETGSTAELFQTLQRIKTLPENTVIYPGHDYGKVPVSTIGAEKINSAAFRCQSIEELHALP
jgi:hydroxyacylglutathione hydrolase